MPDTTPETRGPLLQMLGDVLGELNRLNVLIAYAPDISDRETHLLAIQEGTVGIAAVLPDVDPLDPPEES